MHLWYVVLVCHQYYVCKHSVSSVYIGGSGGLSERDSESSVNCVQTDFLLFVNVRRFCCIL